MHTFETARLLMRPLQADDEAFYCSCYTDPVLMQHIGEPLSQEAALKSFNAALKAATQSPKRRYTWAMQEKKSGAAIGLLAMFGDDAKPEPINAELGTIMLTEFQNQGFTAEALRGLAGITFTSTQLNALIVKHKNQNKAVAGVMAKLGYLCTTDKIQEISVTQWVLSRGHWQSSTNVIKDDYNSGVLPIT